MEELPLVWRAVVVVAIVVVGAVGGSWLGMMVRTGLARTGLAPEVRGLLVRGVRPLVMVVALIAAATYLRIDLTAVTAMLGASTLAVGLALQGFLSNVAAGAMLLTLRPVRVGELVQLGGVIGTLVELDWFTVTMDLPDGTRVTMPNNTVFGGVIHNFSRRGNRRVEVRVLLEHGADLGDAADALRELAEADPRVLSDPAPAALALALEDRGVRFCVRAWVAAPDFAAVTSALSAGVPRALGTRGVALAPPPLSGV